MPLKTIAEGAVKQICEQVLVSLSDDERIAVQRIVEQAIVDATVSATQRCHRIVRQQTGPEADLAHKIAEEIRDAETALIANLMGMR